MHSTSVEDDIRILALITTGTSVFHNRMLDLIGQVIYFNDIIGIPNSFDAKLSSALDAVDEVYEKNKGAAIKKLQAFIKTVESQRNKLIPDDYADALIEEVQEIIDMLSVQLAISNSTFARSIRKNH